MQVGDEVLSFNVATHAMEWKPVRAVHSHAVDPRNAADALFRMQGSGMDVIATRHHRMLLARVKRHSANSRAVGRRVVYETVGELLRLTYRSDRTSLSRSVVCAGFNPQPGVKVVIPGLEQVCDWWWQQDGQLGFLRFLGFWLRDGSLNAAHGQVRIAQKKEVDKQWLEQLLPRVFPRWWHSSPLPSAPGHAAYTVSCPPLYAYLRLMAIGPLGYNPRDPEQLRSYPHFTKDEGLAAEEQKSDGYVDDNTSGYLSTWTEDAMLAAFTAAEEAADPGRCSHCRRADWEVGQEMVMCSEGCQHGGHLQCAGLTAEPEGDWLCPACRYVVEATDGVEDEADAAPSPARRSSVSAATTESSTSQSASDERCFSFSGYIDHGEEKDGKQSPAALQPVDSDVLDDPDDGTQAPLAEAVEDRLLAQQLRAAGAVVWWSSGLWIIINGSWFYLKRWLGVQNVANVYSRLSRQQAVALLDGCCRADGDCQAVRYDDGGEPTGVWRCSNSSFPLIDELMLIGQLAGAAVHLALLTKAGKTTAVDGRRVTCSVDQWQLHFSFTSPARLPMQTTPLAQPVDVSDGQARRGCYQYAGDGRVWCITVEGNANFLTQRLSSQRLTSGSVGVRAHSVFVGNCLSRPVAGIRRSTLCITLPGSTAAVEQSMQALLPVLPHALCLMGEQRTDADSSSPTASVELKAP